MAKCLTLTLKHLTVMGYATHHGTPKNISYHGLYLTLHIVAGGNLSNVLHYKKPVKRPEPVLQPPPAADEILPARDNIDVRKASNIELIYTLARSDALQGDYNGQTFPPWGPFHVGLSPGADLPESTIAYSPILMAPPNDYSTIYTMLMRSREIANTLGHSDVPVYFDMGLLTKALEIAWASPEDLAGVFPCEGGMHLMIAVMAGVGKLYGNAGLEQLLQDSGVFAAGTVQQILNGRDFDRGLYAMKLLDEVLYAQLLKEFQLWCNKYDKKVHAGVLDLLVQLCAKYEEGMCSPETTQTIIDQLLVLLEESLLPLLAEFRKEGCLKSSTFQFWDDFLQRVLGPIKVFISATRDGNWAAYQSAKAELLPLLFASNRTTYAKYMPVLLLKMKRLPPHIIHDFVEKQFVAKLSQGKFNGTWMDYALEATENKSLKGVGGIIGLTLRGPSLARWFLSRPVTASYSTSFSSNICHPRKEKPKGSEHHSTSKAEIKRWNNDVRKMNEMFNDTYINPFNTEEVPKELINFATGVVARPDVQDSMLKALDKGSEKAIKFVNERLVCQDDEERPAKSVYATMTRNDLKTMADMSKAVSVKSKTVSISGELMYLRLLAINSKKKVPLENENAPVPLSIFNDDGSMLSGNKAVFMHKLETLLDGDPITSIPGADTIIFDGNVVIQMLKVPSGPETTYKSMAMAFQEHILRVSKAICGNALSQVHVVFDRYLQSSIKGDTRVKRSGTSKGNIHLIIPDGRIPKDWKLFLREGKNKTALVSFYTDYLISNISKELDATQVVYISGGKAEKAFAVKKGSPAEEYLPLKCDHEEADTRVILHAKVASEVGTDSVVVSSPDTDVLVLYLHHRPDIQTERLYFHTGHGGKHTSTARFIPV